MTATHALIWKTGRDLRAFLVGGLLFTLLPTAFMAMQQFRRTGGSSKATDLPEVLVTCLGAMAAILIAVHLVCRDTSEPLLTFWSSRPVGVLRFLLIKYLSGAAVLAVVTVVPLLVQIGIAHDSRGILYGSSYAAFLVFAHTWTLLLIYSAAFAIAAAARRAVPAAMLSLAAAGAIYFVPLLVPALGFMDTFRFTWVERVFTAVPVSGIPALNPLLGRFVISTVVLDACLLAVAVFLVKRGLCWHPAQRAIMWTFGLELLLIFWGGARDIGSTLHAEKTAELGGVSASWEGVGVRDGVPRFAAAVGTARGTTLTVCRYGDLPAGAVPAQHMEIHKGRLTRPVVFAGPWAERVFSLEVTGSPVERADLVTADLSAGTSVTFAKCLDLLPWFRVDPATAARRPADGSVRPVLRVHGDRLFIAAHLDDWSALILPIDISRPDKPVPGEAVRIQALLATQISQTGDYMMVPRIPGLPLHERMQLVAELELDNNVALCATTDAEDTIVCMARRRPCGDRGIQVLQAGAPTAPTFERMHFSLAASDKNKVDLIPLEPLGEYRPSLLKRLMMERVSQLMLSGSMLYVSYGSLVEVIDARNPRAMRSVGQYSAPGGLDLRLFAPLRGNGVVAGGRALHTIMP